MISQRTRELIAESVRYMTWLSEKIQDERVDILEHLSEMSFESKNITKMTKDAQTSLASTKSHHS